MEGILWGAASLTLGWFSVDSWHEVFNTSSPTSPGRAPNYCPLDFLLLTAAFLTLAGKSLHYLAVRRQPLQIASGAGIVTLGSFLVISLDDGRGATSRILCKNNLKQIGLSIHNFHDEHRHLPPQAAGDPAVSWRVTILPYIDHQHTFDNYDRTSPWNSDQNLAVSRLELDGFHCPSRPAGRNDDQQVYAAYFIPTGPGTTLIGDTEITFRDISDGSSNTIAVVENAFAPLSGRALRTSRC